MIGQNVGHQYMQTSTNNNRYEPSYKQLGEKTNRKSFLSNCGSIFLAREFFQY
jgi:hypothetical protein